MYKNTEMIILKSRKIIALAMAVIMMNGSVFAKSTQELYDERNEIKEKQEEAQKELTDVKEKKKTLAQEIDALDMELNAAQDEVKRLTGELTYSRIRLANVSMDLYFAEIKRKNQRKTMKKRIRYMYENGSQGYLQLIFHADGFNDFMKRLEYVNCIMNYDQNLFDEMKKTEKVIGEKVMEEQKEKENLDTLTKLANDQKSFLEEKVAEKNTIMLALTKDEETFMKQLEDLETASSNVSTLILKAQAEDLAKGKIGTIYNAEGGLMQYPVPNYRGVTSPFGGRINPISGKSEFHTGVDLNAVMNADIVAAEKGKVIYASWMNGYGNTVIIDHGNGISTLYAHNTSLIVSVGQEVERGQVISLAGTTGYSTGPHLHFEVRVNGQYVDPLNYIAG